MQESRYGNRKGFDMKTSVFPIKLKRDLNARLSHDKICRSLNAHVFQERTLLFSRLNIEIHQTEPKLFEETV